jgi:hypothetical protein
VPTAIKVAHAVNGTKVTKLFDLYAYHHLPLDSLQERLD